MWLPLSPTGLRILAATGVTFFSVLGSVASAVTIDDFSVGSIEVARTGTMAATAYKPGSIRRMSWAAAAVFRWESLAEPGRH